MPKSLISIKTFHQYEEKILMTIFAILKPFTNMYRCIIIDDDRHAIISLEKYIDSFPTIELVASYTDPLKALTAIMKSDPVDLILLDIDMPKINGIELSKEIRGKTDKLVFTTGHAKYGYNAFKVHANDYLLKPFSLGEFMISMNKIFPGQTNTAKNDFFFVKTKDDHQIVNIKYRDVIAIESKLNYVMIHTTKKSVLTYMSLNEISKLFKVHPEFIQFQRSYIISKKCIKHFDGDGIVMINGTQLKVGKYYRKSFYEFVDNHLLRAERKS